ncbi:MAG: GtrA family protein [Rhodoferax sp.]|uniref:GtrA family protein n=1 Tax=Rhodoferax sp. TaxID=50421 RepID=UPI0026245BB4|nr:GtrA family protein [Rhodoferax sp.]MDD2881506.1 GtrA family protein [Rhodoferax sp.]
MKSEFIRFLLVGTANTILGWALFVALAQFTPYPVAYTLAYATGVVISYFLSVRFVFRRRSSLVTFLKFPFVYMLQYMIGLLLMWILIGKMNISPEFAMAAVIVLTVPITFLTSRKIFKTSPRNGTGISDR